MICEIGLHHSFRHNILNSKNSPSSNFFRGTVIVVYRRIAFSHGLPGTNDIKVNWKERKRRAFAPQALGNTLRVSQETFEKKFYLFSKQKALRVLLESILSLELADLESGLKFFFYRSVERYYLLTFVYGLHFISFSG